jgi:uncharacterized SAM-binding protein YcdF (DUF218 family)
MSLRRRVLWGMLLLAVALALLWASRLCLLRTMAWWLDVGQKPQPAEYVMVLAGDEDTRPFVAAALVKAGFARGVLVTQTAATPAVADQILPPSHQIIREVLLSRGVAAGDITILPAAATSTHDEAVALADFLRDRPKSRVLVVTSDFHTRRSRWVFSRVLSERAERVAFVSAPTDEFRLDCWWQNEEGFVAVASEYLKLAFYVVRYGYVAHWLAACGGLALVAAAIRRRARVAA